MVRIARQLPHDFHLRAQQGADGVVARDDAAVGGEENAHLAFGIGGNLIAEGGGWEGEAERGGVSALVMKMMMMMMAV